MGSKGRITDHVEPITRSRAVRSSFPGPEQGPKFRFIDKPSVLQYPSRMPTMEKVPDMAPYSHRNRVRYQVSSHSRVIRIHLLTTWVIDSLTVIVRVRIPKSSQMPHRVQPPGSSTYRGMWHSGLDGPFQPPRCYS
jgi:hypothetical protein